MAESLNAWVVGKSFVLHLLANVTSLDQTSNLNRFLPTMPHRTVPVWMPKKHALERFGIMN
jgi:hypothetical protein